jgi:DNA-binding GntR family transcriptional regulator
MPRMHAGRSPEDRTAPSVTRTTLQVPSLVDALYAEIRERILTGAVPAGTHVEAAGATESAAPS